jgi:aminopeptidase N
MNTPSPLGYIVRLEPDLDGLEFTGSVRIDLTTGGCSSIELDSVELEIDGCHELRNRRALELQYSLTEGTINIQLGPDSSDQIELAIDFHGKLNRDLRGLYAASYMHEGEKKHLAVTQFEEIEARRAFPCFDHPKFNTPFVIELVIGEGQAAIATTRVEEETTLEDGRKLVRFRRTPPMPTYLLFFGTGNFEFLEGTECHVPIRVAATPGKAAYGAKSIEFARKSIEFCEAFTGVDYPVDKLDLIAVPEFAYGGMENLGAITYRENLLLYYPDVVSRVGLQNIAAINAHEVAHMWFGDLTSPRDWQFVWLNEAFATYVGNLILDAAYPDWHAMDQFLLSAGHAAMGRDSLKGTIPIEFPDAGLTEIDSSTAPIIYAKAGLVLRMVHQWVGEEVFTSGVRSYLSAFEYDSTDTDGFLTEFGKGAGLEAANVINNWIRQPGFPVVEARRSTDTLTIAQQRFVYGDAEAAAGAEPGQTWIIPISILLFFEDGSTQTQELVLREAKRTIQLPEGVSAFKLNPGQTGFYRSAYSPSDLERLGAVIAVLAPRDASGLLADLAALTIKGDLTVSQFLDYLLQHFSTTEEYIVLSQISTSLRELWTLVPDLRETTASAGRTLLEPAFARIGLVSQPDEPYSSVLLRDEIVWSLLLFDSKGVRDGLRPRFEAIVGGNTVETDLIPHVLRFGALAGTLSGGGEAFLWFRKVLEDPDAVAEMKKHVYQAIGWFAEEETISQVIEYAMSSVQPQDRILVIRALAANPAADHLMWPWLKAHFSEVVDMHAYFRSVILAEVVPTCPAGAESELASLLDGYLDAADDPPLGVLTMAREKRNVYIRLREANSGEVTCE